MSEYQTKSQLSITGQVVQKLVILTLMLTSCVPVIFLSGTPTAEIPVETPTETPSGCSYHDN